MGKARKRNFISRLLGNHSAKLIPAGRSAELRRLCAGCNCLAMAPIAAGYPLAYHLSWRAYQFNIFLHERSDYHGTSACRNCGV